MADDNSGMWGLAGLLGALGLAGLLKGKQAVDQRRASGATRATSTQATTANRTDDRSH